MTGKPGYDALRPARYAILPKTSGQERHKAIQRTLRVASRDAWSRTEICDVLEALGLVEPSSLVPTPSGGADSASTGRSGAATRPQRQWCRRNLHRMTPENVYTAPSGDRRCRRCWQALRAGADPATMHPAEPGSPEYKPPAPISEDLWCGRKLHVLIGDNLIHKTDGSRECRACRLWRKRRDRARRRGVPFDEELS